MMEESCRSVYQQPDAAAVDDDGHLGLVMELVMVMAKARPPARLTSAK